MKWGTSKGLRATRERSTLERSSRRYVERSESSESDSSSEEWSSEEERDDNHLVTRDQVLDELRAQEAADALGESLKQLGYNIDNCETFYSLDNDKEDQRYVIPKGKSKGAESSHLPAKQHKQRKSSPVKKTRGKSSEVPHLRSLDDNSDEEEMKPRYMVRRDGTFDETISFSEGDPRYVGRPPSPYKKTQTQSRRRSPSKYQSPPRIPSRNMKRFTLRGSFSATGEESTYMQTVGHRTLSSMSDSEASDEEYYSWRERSPRKHVSPSRRSHRSDYSRSNRERSSRRNHSPIKRKPRSESSHHESARRRKEEPKSKRKEDSVYDRDIESQAQSSHHEKKHSHHGSARRSKAEPKPKRKGDAVYNQEVASEAQSSHHEKSHSHRLERRTSKSHISAPTDSPGDRDERHANASSHVKDFRSPSLRSECETRSSRDTTTGEKAEHSTKRPSCEVDSIDSGRPAGRQAQEDHQKPMIPVDLDHDALSSRGSQASSLSKHKKPAALKEEQPKREKRRSIDKKDPQKRRGASEKHRSSSTKQKERNMSDVVSSKRKTKNDSKSKPNDVCKSTSTSGQSRNRSVKMEQAEETKPISKSPASTADHTRDHAQDEVSVKIIMHSVPKTDIGKEGYILDGALGSSEGKATVRKVHHESAESILPTSGTQNQMIANVAEIDAQTNHDKKHSSENDSVFTGPAEAANDSSSKASIRQGASQENASSTSAAPSKSMDATHEALLTEHAPSKNDKLSLIKRKFTGKSWARPMLTFRKKNPNNQAASAVFDELIIENNSSKRSTKRESQDNAHDLPTAPQGVAVDDSITLDSVVDDETHHPQISGDQCSRQPESIGARSHGSTSRKTNHTKSSGDQSSSQQGSTSTRSSQSGSLKKEAKDRFSQYGIEAKNAEKRDNGLIQKTSELALTASSMAVKAPTRSESSGSISLLKDSKGEKAQKSKVIPNKTENSVGFLDMASMAVMLPLAPLAAAYSCYTSDRVQKYLTAPRCSQPAQCMPSKAASPCSSRRAMPTQCGNVESTALRSTTAVEKQETKKIEKIVDKLHGDSGSNNQDQEMVSRNFEKTINTIEKKKHQQKIQPEHSEEGDPNASLVSSLVSLHVQFASTDQMYPPENFELITTVSSNQSGSTNNTRLPLPFLRKRAPKRRSHSRQTHIQDGEEGIESFLPEHLMSSAKHAKTKSAADDETPLSRHQEKKNRLDLGEKMQLQIDPEPSKLPTKKKPAWFSTMSKGWLPKISVRKPKAAKSDSMDRLTTEENHYTEEVKQDKRKSILSPQNGKAIRWNMSSSRVPELLPKNVKKMKKQQISSRSSTSTDERSGTESLSLDQTQVDGFTQALRFDFPGVQPQGKSTSFVSCAEPAADELENISSVPAVKMSEPSNVAMNHKMRPEGMTHMDQQPVAAAISQSQARSEFPIGPSYSVSRASSADDAISGYGSNKLVPTAGEGSFRQEYADGYSESSVDPSIDPSTMAELLAIESGSRFEVEDALRKLKKHARKLGISERDLLYGLNSGDSVGTSFDNLSGGSKQNHVRAPTRTFGDRLLDVFDTVESYFGPSYVAPKR